MDLTSLSPREHQIIELIKKGHTSQEMADELGVTKRTAVTHTYHIFRKLGVHSRAALVAELNSVAFFKGNPNEAKTPEADRAV